MYQKINERNQRSGAAASNMDKPKRPKATVEQYNGGNDYLDAIYTPAIDGPVFMVNGRIGRLPIFADTAEEALRIYLDRVK